MRTLLTLPLAVVCLLSSPTGAQALDSGPPPLSAKRVTLSRHEVSLEKVLKELFAGSGEHYSLSHDVAKLQLKVDAELADVPFDEALRRVMEVARRQSPNLTAYRLLTTEVSGGLASTKSSQKRSYSIRFRSTGTAKDLFTGPRGSELPGLEQRVSLDVRQLPLRQLVARAFSPESIINLSPGESPLPPRLEVDAGVPDVPITLKYRGVTLDTAVRLIAAAAGEQVADLSLSTAEQSWQDYVLSRETDPGNLDWRTRVREFIAEQQMQPVTLESQGRPLKSLVAQVLPNGPLLPPSHLVEREVWNLPVTVSVNAATPEEALRQIVAAASRNGAPVTYTRVGSLFAVHLQR